jgi:alkylhydroperoxidase/carboxymuconolactone decarboxylase family protein YurZ
VHLRSSLDAGLSADELREVILQVAVLAGFPPAMNAMSTLRTIEAETRDQAEGEDRPGPPRVAPQPNG